MNEKFQEIWPIETGITDLPTNWQDLASAELPFARDLWQRQRENLEGTEQLATFTERLAREWAIETGVIENLYQLDRGVTQTLIEHGFQSALIEHGSTNKPRDYVIRLLQDQKDALAGLFSFVKQDRPLTTSYIKELHAAMTQSQLSADSVDPQGRRIQVELIRGEWKRWPNYPMKNGNELRYCPPEQTASQMYELISMFEKHAGLGVPPEVEAAWLHHRFTQIHPFQDGNGRVARALASLVFMRSGLFPLVVTRDNKTAYLDALESADAGDLGPLVQLFTQLQLGRFRRATNLVDKIQKPARSVEEALEGLVRTVSSRQEPNGATESRVTDLRDLALKQLTSLASRAGASLRSLGPKCGIQVHASAGANKKRFLEMARFAGANSFGVLPIRPCAWVAIEYHVPQVRRAIFHVSGIDPRLDGLIQVIAFMDDETRFPPTLTNDLVEWYPAETEASILPRFDDWLERAFIDSLSRVQQSL